MTLTRSTPDVSLLGMTTSRRPWRRCSSCYGVCHWHDEAWVCDDCGDEWFPADPNAPGWTSQYDPPGECKRRGCEYPEGHIAEHPCTSRGVPMNDKEVGT